jgi:hypothetical protein
MREKLYNLRLLFFFCVGVFCLANAFADIIPPSPPPPPTTVAPSANKNQLTQIQALFHHADYMDLAQPVNEFSTLVIAQ